MTPALNTMDGTEKAVVDEVRIETASLDGVGLVEGEGEISDASGTVTDSTRRTDQERSLIRKVDIRLLPIVFALFIMNYVDRIAVTSARLKGLEQDLRLSDVQYDAVVAIVYASYCPAQIPSNMILNYTKRPSWYIGICAVLWGLTSALTGLTHNFPGIIACRFLLGFPESAFYPGAMYLLSRWYTRKELAFRSAMFYTGLLLSNAFGSLLAAVILSGMEGRGGIRGWRWLFFIEGGLTICIGLLSMWSLPDYPADTRWLLLAERRLAQARLAEDVGEADQDNEDESIWTGLKLACKDIKVYIFAIVFMSTLLGLSFINFFPTLTSTLGFSTTISLLLAAPPWIFATILCFMNAFHADRTGERFFHMTVPWWGVIVSYIIGVSTSSVGGRYVAMFLMANGYSGTAMVLVWLSNTVSRPPAKRAVAIAMVNGFGNLGSALGSFAWKAKWGPAYHQSMLIGIAALVFSSLFAFMLRCILVRENRIIEKDESVVLTGADRKRVEEFARLQGVPFDEAMRLKRGFRYLY